MPLEINPLPFKVNPHCEVCDGEGRVWSKDFSDFHRHVKCPECLKLNERSVRYDKCPLKLNEIKEEKTMKMNNCSKCGSHVQLISRDYSPLYFTIKCQNKNCDNMLETFDCLKEDIIRNWNERNPIKQEMKMNKCSKCGSERIYIYCNEQNHLYYCECSICENKTPLEFRIQKHAIENWNNLNSIKEEKTMKMNNCSKCGKAPKIEYECTEHSDVTNYYVKCSCGKYSQFSSAFKDKAIELWNYENPIEKESFRKEEKKKTKLEDRPKTIFTDLDGCLIKHCGNVCEQHLLKGNDILLPDTLEKIREWDLKGYRIIITTGRKESTRAATEKQLSELGILYDQLIMGITGGVRVIINDTKPNNDQPTCVAINVPRNKGLEEVEI